MLLHKRLGSVRDKVGRLEQLALDLAGAVGAAWRDLDRADLRLAAALCKNDLVTGMVGEFPALQGVLGRHYALADGVSEPVAAAIEQHYLPRFAGDRLPDAPLGQCLALADKADTLIGIFACHERPTGDKDPYGLRRAALGLLRILAEHGLALGLERLLTAAMAVYRESGLERIDTGDEVVSAALEFVTERMKGYFTAQGFTADQIAAVAAGAPRSPADCRRRLVALRQFLQEHHDDAAALAAANKRIANILAQAGIELDSTLQVDHELFREPAEKTLGERVCSDQLRLLLSAPEISRGQAPQYTAALRHLAGLRQPIDDFFEQVMVNHEDPRLRRNRLALLGRIRSLFLSVADFSQLRAAP